MGYTAPAAISLCSARPRTGANPKLESWHAGQSECLLRGVDERLGVRTVGQLLSEEPWREPDAHVRLVLLVEVGEVGRSTERLALHSEEALGVEQLSLGEGLDGGQELLEDLARVVQRLAHRAVAVRLVDPGVDLVIGLEMGWPGWRRLRITAKGGLQAAHRSPAPAGVDKATQVA
jgi:hypothetical protein